MQVTFLKDLATIRNPTSRFSFLAYLRERGRLLDFINHKSLFPSRVEVHDYLEWAAAQLVHQVVDEFVAVAWVALGAGGIPAWAGGVESAGMHRNYWMTSGQEPLDDQPVGAFDDHR
jgi:L-ornithine N5-oxygenase